MGQPSFSPLYCLVQKFVYVRANKDVIVHHMQKIPLAMELF
jgi:hypothetical protein